MPPANMRTDSMLVILALVTALQLTWWPGTAVAADRVQFNRDIRPILSDKCFFCHGPDKNHREGDLRLDVREDALARHALVPGQPDESLLIQRIVSEDADERMPPPGSHKELAPKQKELLKRWISEGAEYQPHWAFLPPDKPRPPELALELDEPRVVIRNPIDAFIVAKLRAEGLQPSPEATKEALIRRVSLDLTGLPPTVEEVDQFLCDQSEAAYEKVVDRLLKSPHYGERMAIDWLDAARYADTNGYQVDRDRELWLWRDWVIRAFNDNMPFDQFTVEQLAGDLLPDATLDQRVATGFHRNHMLNEEGGIIPAEFLAEYTADRVETTGAVWLGQTFNCARCHDHKFDPFTQRDFYALKAFFHNVPEQGVGQYGKPIRENAPPFVEVASSEDAAALAQLEAQSQAYRTERENLLQQASIGLAEWARQVCTAPVQWQPIEMVAKSEGDAATGATVEKHSIEIAPRSGQDKPNIVRVRLPAGVVTALSVEGTATVDTQANLKWRGVRLRRGKQTLEMRPAETVDSLTMAESAKLLDDKSETSIAQSGKAGQPLRAVFELATRLQNEAPATITVELDFESPTEPSTWQFFWTDIDPQQLMPAKIRELARKLAEAEGEPLASAEQKELANFRAVHSPEYHRLTAASQALDEQMRAVRDRIPTTLVMAEMAEPRPTFVLLRGAYDKPGEAVTAATPAALPPLDDALPRNRLGLARWLVAADHPLTARVTVNRFWQQVFGTGLVRTSEDFGSQGEPPSHPELLDWLAVTFRESGWNVKQLMRLMVTSATYRQRSDLSGQLAVRDPENRLLARGPRQRLMAELVRDQALAVSGLLVTTIGGPSVKPYHPAGLYEQVTAGKGTNVYVPGEGVALFRRSLYTYWKRSVPHPAMLLFDAPFRETCSMRRPRSNTPLQALNVMNDPTYVEAARMLASRMLREGGQTTESRLTYAYRTVLSRGPTSREIEVLCAAVERCRADFANDGAAAAALVEVGTTRPDARLDTAELAAYTTVASTLLNLDETIMK